jgi:hypothetical protein
MTNFFGVMSPEQRAINLADAHKASVAKAAFNKENEHKYKLDYMDSKHWQELGSKYNIRMPTHNEPASIKIIKKYLRKAKVETTVWNETLCSMTEWLEYNPTWTAYAVAGLILEMKEMNNS